MKSSMALKTITFALMSTALFLTTACDRSRTSDLMHKPPTYSYDKAEGATLTIQFNPKVDILFVIDNSLSMKEEQEKLRAATESFIEKLGGNSVLDYRVGVITVYDPTHCSKFNNCYPAGKLRSPFVSRNENAAAQLREALNVGVLDYREGGPEFEQLFYPIAQAFSPEMNRENGNFIRPDSHVVIVMVTDESDSSIQLSIDDFLDGIERTARLSRVDMYAIVAKDAINRNNYAQDRAPIRIRNAIIAADGIESADKKIFSIDGNADFGAHLATIVGDIKRRVMSQQLWLPSIPEAKTIRVFYGDDEIKENQGWSYNPPMPTANGAKTPPSITIHENVKVNYDPKKRFRAEYIKIEDHSVRNGKVTSIFY